MPGNEERLDRDWNGLVEHQREAMHADRPDGEQAERSGAGRSTVAALSALPNGRDFTSRPSRTAEVRSA